MSTAFNHRVLDQVNAAQDRRIADLIRRNPRVLKAARATLDRWMAAEKGAVRPVFLEWHAILHRLTAREIAAFLTSETPMARRLRQSSPAVAFLSTSDRQAIRRRYAKGRA